ncbi:MAG: Na+/H+ antiporter NhaC [Planctomycetota bacterium]|jgi:Na+/H+ antiporter NhaC
MLTRLLSLLLFASIVIGLFWLPDPDTNKLAAVQVGGLLNEPAMEAPDVDWRTNLAAGDVVLNSEGEAEVLEVGDGFVVLHVPGPDPRGVEQRVQISSLEERVSRASVWSLLMASDAISEAAGIKTLTLGGMRLISEVGTVNDPMMHGEARRSLMRSLRAIFASEGIECQVNGAKKPESGGAEVAAKRKDGALELSIVTASGNSIVSSKSWSPPARSSLYPPLLAILLAILFRKPVLALFFGVLTGSFLMVNGAGESVGSSIVPGLQQVFTRYFWDELIDTDRQLIVTFVFFMLAMVGVMTRSGGIRGMMDAIAKMARSVRHTQIATYLMGLAIFFDDYANTILVGSTMRPLTDRWKIAREKLAYIVDSTAAPVAGLSIFSTWIAFEVSTFSAQLPDVGYAVEDGYRIFLETLPYRFYCIFTLFFVGMVVVSGRDFGPMLSAERRARKGQLIREGSTPLSGGNTTSLEPAAGVSASLSRALLPIATFVTVTLGWMAWKGGAFGSELSLFKLRDLARILGDGDSFRALMLGALSGFIVACLLALSAGLRSDIWKSALESLRSMGVAFLILYLAWMIGAVCGDLGTAPFLTVLVGDALNPLLLPVILFLLSGVIAFSTGSSWSTMTILLPIVVGLAFGLGDEIDIGGHALMILCIGAVLEGAIFGDHCSPISDTTVMSSIASASDHIDHVRTQAPYAILTMVVAMLVGYFPCTFLGWNPFISIGLGLVVMWVCLLKFGERIDSDATQAPREA